ncbi:hypothetical protein [Epilithonimonas hungarica]|uniref:Uncharacterized protein n=1 Tax=Epilithonimonas hungarica TaxID=454006 RepID=A0A1G7RVD1_9FLAO|nr:hypothetical protein [Epilithonimonas hungarica]MPT32285.1 hypothetical protein [Chryseobacterium sp.]SDG14777.1 hypothetical protein SAMN05421825_2793 [Epilithonimonas hungarica]
MKKYQETIYKIILIFSVLINIFLIVLLFFVLRDSLSGHGEWFLDGRSFWYFIGVILAYSLANSIFIVRFLKIKSIKE